MNKLKIICLFVCALALTVPFSSCSSTQEAPQAAPQKRQPTYLSPMAEMLQADLRKLDREVTAQDTELIERYSLRRRGNSYCIPAILTLDPPYADGELEQYGVLVQSVQDDMATVLLSTREYLRLIDSRTVKAIDISPKVQLH